MSKHWSIASAKAELSQVVRRAKRSPQILENRGEAVAVVVGIDDYRRLADREDRRTKWLEFLALSAELREQPGPELELPSRSTRENPFVAERKR